MRVGHLGIKPENSIAIFALNFGTLPHIHIDFGVPESSAAAIASHTACLNDNDVVMCVGFV